MKKSFTGKILFSITSLFLIAAPIFAQQNPFAPNPATLAAVKKDAETKDATTTAETAVAAKTVDADLTLLKFTKNEFSSFAASANGNRPSELNRQTAWTYTRPSAKERAKKYADRTVGPYTLIGVAVGAGFAQASDNPEDWENNGKGYARRFASNFGENAIEQTIVFGLDETFKVDSLFYKKGKGTKLSARFANAVLTTVTARTKSGRRVPGFARFAGIYASNIISTTTWYPDRFSYQDGLRQGTISLGFDAAFNLVREFIFPGKRK